MTKSSMGDYLMEETADYDREIDLNLLNHC